MASLNHLREELGIPVQNLDYIFIPERAFVCYVTREWSIIINEEVVWRAECIH